MKNLCLRMDKEVAIWDDLLGIMTPRSIFNKFDDLDETYIQIVTEIRAGTRGE